MNKYQKAYAVARALLDTLNATEEAIERKYIVDNKVVNPDGTTPDRIYCIEDEDTFDKANEGCADLPESKVNFQKIIEARKVLEQAENNLIAYGLSLAPAKEREILTKSAATNYTTRRKILDLAFRLDTRTVRA
jgi:hypothetical protein